jgi:hypothetical protein
MLQITQQAPMEFGFIGKYDGSVLNGDDALFLVTGAPIFITHFFGVVTTLIGGAANCTIQGTTTTPAATTAFSTTVAIDNDAAGTTYAFSTASPGVLTPVTNGIQIAIGEVQWLMPIGSIIATCSAAQDGVIAWYMRYLPLSTLSRVIAAP